MTMMKSSRLTKDKHPHSDKKFLLGTKAVVHFRISLCISVFVTGCLLLLRCSYGEDSNPDKSITGLRVNMAITKGFSSTSPSSSSSSSSSSGRMPFPHLAMRLQAGPRALFGPSRPALHGLGTAFIRGSTAMDELVVAHVAEQSSPQDLRLLLRTFYRSGLAARADMVLLFESNVVPAAMRQIIYKEHTHLCRLLSENLLSTKKSSLHDDQYQESKFSPFEYQAYVKDVPAVPPIWEHHHSQATMKLDGQFVFGSVIGFDVAELNPENTLEGFIDSPPMELRRWACYQLLLGMVRRQFKHVLLIGVSGAVIMGDPLAMARNKAGLYLSLEDVTWGSSFAEVTQHEIWDDNQINSHDARIAEASQVGNSHYGAIVIPRVETIDPDPVKVVKEDFLWGAKGLRRALEGLDKGSMEEASKSKEEVHQVLAVGFDGKGSTLHGQGSVVQQTAGSSDSNLEAMASSSKQQHSDSLPHKSLESVRALSKLSSKHHGGWTGQHDTVRKWYMHRRITRMKNSRRASSHRTALGGGGYGLYEKVYVRTMWNKLGNEERDKQLVTSAAIVGGLRQVERVANAMVTEIARVALIQGSRESFPDNVVLSHLVHKSSVKGLMDKLHLLNSAESFLVYSLVAFQQAPSLFLRSKSRGQEDYRMVSDKYGQVTGRERPWNDVARLVHDDICSSSFHPEVYSDC